MRPALLLLLTAALPARSWAQAAAATDLWRVAAATLTTPAALDQGGLAAAWTPASVLPAGVTVRVGVDAVHAPAETGVNGGLAAVSVAAGRATVSASYGRLGIGDVAFTETSPEAVGGAIPIWSQAASLGVALAPRADLVAGIAARVLSGRLGPAEHSQFGLDVGAQYRGIAHLALGVATQFMDPTFGESADGAGYSLGAAYTAGPFDAWGAPATLALRYGVSFLRGEDAQHLLVGGLAMGWLGLDWGAARESAFGADVWRSRFGVSVASAGYHVAIGRDGGVNGFGATWRFSLTAEFR